MTLRQLELWVHLAVKDRDDEARIVAHHLAQPLAELVQAMFTALLKR